MKTIKYKNRISKKGILISSLLLLLVGIFTAVTVYALNQNSNTIQDSSSESKTEVSEGQAEGSNAKPGVIENGATDSKIQSPHPSITQTEELAVPRILSARQDGMTIRVSADFSESASGLCHLRLLKDGETTIEQTVDIIIVPSGYACNGFTATVPSFGGWQANIVHSLDSRNSIEVTKTVE